MRSVEFGKIFNYSGKIIRDASGITAYRESKQRHLELYAGQFTPEDNEFNAKADGVLFGTGELLAPLTVRLIRGSLRASKGSDENSPIVSTVARVISSTTAAMAADVGMDVVAALLVADGKIAEGLSLKAGYNIATSVGPDVLRSMKQTFQNLRSKPPSAAII